MPRPGVKCEHGIIRCVPCYNKKRRDKRPKVAPLRTMPPAERLAALTDKTPGHGPRGECWIYLGSKTKGYGTVSRNGKNVYAHRLAYELYHGHLNPGLDVCHHCDFPPCVRPDHLFAGTAKDNTVDMVRKGRQWLQGNSEKALVAKLSWEVVRDIRAARSAGQSRGEIASRYGITVWTVSDITSNSTWKEIDYAKLNPAIETKHL